MNASCGLKIVKVHDDVDHEIECDGDPRDRRLVDELGKAEESRGAMMICMEES